MRSRAWTWMFVGIVLGAAPVRFAEAAPSFPRTVQSSLGLNYEPPCRICHEYDKTGAATPIEPFAWSLRARGLSGPENLITALNADEADGVDSDGDGVPDVAELRAGTDPNSPANDCLIPSGTPTEEGQCSATTTTTPQLGCAIGAVGMGGFAAPVAAAMAAALACLASRRRRR